MLLNLKLLFWTALKLMVDWMKRTSSTVEFEISVTFDIWDVGTSRVLLKLLVEVLWLIELLWTFCFIAWYNHRLLWRLNFQLLFELWGFWTLVILLNLKLLFWTALKLVVYSMKQSSPAMPFETELTENTFLLSIVVWSLSGVRFIPQRNICTSLCLVSSTRSLYIDFVRRKRHWVTLLQKFVKLNSKIILQLTITQCLMQ